MRYIRARGYNVYKVDKPKFAIVVNV